MPDFDFSQNIITDTIDWSVDVRRKIELAFHNWTLDRAEKILKKDRKSFKKWFISVVENLEQDLSTLQYQVILEAQDKILDDIDSGKITKMSQVNTTLYKLLGFIK